MQQESNNAERYKQLQAACALAALVKAVAVLLCIYIIREGHLDQFSTMRLMNFVPRHMEIWRLCCFFVSLSSISYLLLVIAMENVLEQGPRRILRFSIMLAVIGLAIDLQSQAKMMIFFSDISAQLVFGGNFARQTLMLEGWKAVNEYITNAILLANGLYSTTGLLLAMGIIEGKGLPKWLGWTSVPIWVAGGLVSLLVFQGIVQWALVILLSSVIGFIVWTVVAGVVVDSNTLKEPQAEPAN